MGGGGRGEGDTETRSFVKIFLVVFFFFFSNPFDHFSRSATHTSLPVWINRPADKVDQSLSDSRRVNRGARQAREGQGKGWPPDLERVANRNVFHGRSRWPHFSSATLATNEVSVLLSVG